MRWSEIIILGCNAVLLLWLRSVGLKFVEGYSTAKGQNLASKEDIGELTRIVEDVKAENAQILMELKHAKDAELQSLEREHSLRLTAVEKRLQAHQEAYFWLTRLEDYSRSLNGSENVVLDCLQWYKSTCLYLEPEIPGKFMSAFGAAVALVDFIGPQPVHARETAAEYIKQYRAMIKDAFDAIADAVELPQLKLVKRDAGAPDISP